MVKTLPSPEQNSTSTQLEGDDGAHVDVSSEMRKKEFIEIVAEKSGVKKGIAKKVLDVALREMGDALQNDKDLNLPPLGKVSVNRQKELPNAYVMVAKIRRAKGMLEEKTKPDTAQPE
jgi:hypothetical protein